MAWVGLICLLALSLTGQRLRHKLSGFGHDLAYRWLGLVLRTDDAPVKRHPILAAGGAGTVVIAVVLGLWPTHAEANGVTFQCGSALRPKQAMDAYKSTEDPGGLGLIVVQAVDESCEAARSGTTNAGRVAWFIGIGGLLAAAVTRPRRPELA